MNEKELKVLDKKTNWSKEDYLKAVDWLESKGMFDKKTADGVRRIIMEREDEGY